MTESEKQRKIKELAKLINEQLQFTHVLKWPYG